MATHNHQGAKVSAGTISGDVIIKSIFNESPPDPIPNDISFRVEKPEINFTGRSLELGDLARLSISSDEEIIAVSGMGGVGKTQLARKFIEDCRKNYNNVIWIDSATEENINNDFKHLSDDELNIPTTNNNGKQKDIKSVVQQVVKRLCQRKILFVYDNVDHLNEIMNFLLAVTPPSGSKPHVLITSRTQTWRTGIKVIRLGVWNLRESMEYITTILGEHNDNANEKQSLAETLQYFPLALRQATAFISIQRKRADFKIAAYIKKFERDTCKMLDSSQFKDDSVSQYNKTTYTTWNVTLNDIEEDEFNGQLAIRILKIIAYFDPDDIERDWFSWHFTFGQDQQDDLDEQVKSAVDLLVKYCMIDGRFQLYVHRLVQEVTRLKIEELQELFTTENPSGLRTAA